MGKLREETEKLSAGWEDSDRISAANARELDNAHVEIKRLTSELRTRPTGNVSMNESELVRSLREALRIANEDLDG